MKDGDIVKLVPGISTMKDTGPLRHRVRLAETLKSMTEDVTIITLFNGTGNAKVRDSKGIVFYCNPADLNPLFKD